MVDGQTPYGWKTYRGRHGPRQQDVPAVRAGRLISCGLPPNPPGLWILDRFPLQ
jgi:hypothetical protein